MIAVALKGLAARKVRALLTAFAVVIGVSMISGTLILTDTMQKSFDGLFSATYDKTDAVIDGKEVVENASSQVTVPADVLAKVRALPEVGAASGGVSPDEVGATEVLGSDGEAISRESVGAGYDRENPQFSPFKLKSGSWAEGPRQVVIDAGTADKKHLDLGDSIRVSTYGHRASYEISGTASYGDVDSLGFASMAIWDQETARRLLHREDRYDGIYLAAAKGKTPSEVVRAVRPLLPHNLQVVDAKVKADEDAANVNDGLAFIRYFLLGFGAIALLVGAFVIFNTLSITVAQRTREFATLRTLGGSRKQVMRSVVLEGFAIGLLASVIGLALGLGIAQGLVAAFKALGVELPKASTVVAGSTITTGIIVGTGTTLLASILPARRATRVPPIAAVREGSVLPPSRLAGHSRKAGIGIVAAAVAAMAAGSFGGLAAGPKALLLVGGVLGLFVGIAFLASHVVKPLAGIVGWPARRAGGVAGDLAGANAIRNPGRTASTAAALMIGLTLVTLVAVLGSGLRASMQDAVRDQVHADYVVDGDQETPFRATEGDRLEKVSGVQAASHVRSEKALVQGKEGEVTGIDPATISRFYHYEWAKGSSEKPLRILGTDGAIVSDDFADEHHLSLGEDVSVTTPSGTKRTYEVRGVYEPPSISPLLAPVSISQQAFDASFENAKNKYTFLAADAGAQPALKAAVDGFGDAKFHTGEAFPKDSTKSIGTFLMMLYVLLAFSVVVSLFGMVNTLVLSVFERTRELGMLRAIGMTRRQARRMIRHESIITALIGAAMGLGLGVFLAALATQAMSSYGLGLTLPIKELVAFTVVAVLAGIGAAVMPARRASRLNVLSALHYE